MAAKVFDEWADNEVVVTRQKKKKKGPSQVERRAAQLLQKHVNELRKLGLVYEVEVGGSMPLGIEIGITRFAVDESGKSHQRDMILVASTLGQRKQIYPGDELVAIDGAFLVTLKPDDATALTKILEKRKSKLTLIKGVDRNERLKAQQRNRFQIHVNQLVPADIFECVDNTIIVRQLAPPLTAVVAIGDILEYVDQLPIDPTTFVGITKAQSELSFLRKANSPEDDQPKNDMMISHLFTEESTKLGISIAVARFAHRESSAAVIITNISPQSEVVGLVDVGDEIMAVDGVPLLELDVTDAEIFTSFKKRISKTRPIEITFAKPALTENDAFHKQQVQELQNAHPLCACSLFKYDDESGAHSCILC